MGSRRALVGREQDTTPFNTILLRFCDATPAVGAALVDHQGETVDFAGVLDAFDIKVAAAEWRIVLDLVLGSRVASWPEANELLIRGSSHRRLCARCAAGSACLLRFSSCDR